MRIQKSDSDEKEPLHISFLFISLSFNALIFFITHSACAGIAVNEENEMQVVLTQPSNSRESISESSIINDQPQSLETNSADQGTQQPRSYFQIVQDNYKSKKKYIEVGEALVIIGAALTRVVSPNLQAEIISGSAIECCSSTLCMQCLCDHGCTEERTDGKNDIMTETCIPSGTSLLSVIICPEFCGGGYYGLCCRAAFNSFYSSAASELYVLTKTHAVPQLSRGCHFCWAKTQSICKPEPEPEPEPESGSSSGSEFDIGTDQRSSGDKMEKIQFSVFV